MPFPMVIPHQDGGRVIATVSREEQAAQARPAGANYVINDKTRGREVLRRR
jgi:ribosomal protein L1